MSDPEMSPEASPGGAAASTSPRMVTGVRKVNNMPLFIILGILALFVAIVVSIMVDRANNEAASKVQPVQGQTSADVANKVAGAAPSNAAEIAANGPPVPPASGIPVAPVDPNAPPTPPANGAGTAAAPAQPAAPTAADIRRAQIAAIAAARRAQFGSAVRSPTGIKWQDGRNGGGASNGNASDPASQLVALQQQMAANMAQGRQPTAADVATLTALTNQVSGLTGGGGAGMGAGAGGSNTRQPAGYGQFANSTGGNRWASNAQMETPSRYQLRAGFVIPGTLISGINSQIPGQIVAQVSQNVFDTATGKYLLIPQGSRLVGAYDSNPVFGQSRALVAWQRIVFPDGKAIDLGAMPGSDSAGYAGFHDQVNAHWLRIFGSALLMSGVTAGVTLSQPQTTSINGTISASQALSQALGQQLGQATAMMIEKNLNISPTIIIRPGFRFNVVVVKDLTFSKPYRSFDY